MEPVEFTFAIRPRPMNDPEPAIMARSAVVQILGRMFQAANLLRLIRRTLFIHFRPREEDAAYKAILVSAMRRHLPLAPLTGPLKLDAYCQFEWRKGDSDDFKAAKSRPKDTRPDWDNLGKALGDALQAAGVVEEDARISDGRIRKRWGPRDLIHVRLSRDDGGVPLPGLFDATAVAEGVAL